MMMKKKYLKPAMQGMNMEEGEQLLQASQVGGNAFNNPVSGSSGHGRSRDAYFFSDDWDEDEE